VHVAVVDIGTNSTRLLVADVVDGRLTELDRRSIVTRLGQGVDASGRLADEAMGRVFAALDEYASAIAEHACERSTALMTSAVRDSANGSWFADQVRERYGLDGRILSGDEEARLTFLGATATLPEPSVDRVVIDIGGGSTELVTGRSGVGFHVSMQVGVVRHTERHIPSDPPREEEIAELRSAVAATIAEQVPADVRAAVGEAVAVAGTATSAGAIELALEPYRTEAVEGLELSVEQLAAQLERLAAVGLEERRQVRGLHPDRAPTIVAGLAVLLEVLKAFDLSQMRVSDRDILWAVALESARDELT
jgi:exopolyphosphatase/guanosine-5'-triphosphate,3'-diphosphate pyrophosphatase